MYLDNDALKMLLNETSGKEVSDNFFMIFDGAYVNQNNSGEIAIKTNFWFFGKIFENENIKANNGFLFLNSDYVKNPEFKFSYPVENNDIIYHYKNTTILFEINDDISHVSIFTNNTEENKYFMENIESIGQKKVINQTVTVTNGLLHGNYIIEGGNPAFNLNKNYIELNNSKTPTLENTGFNFKLK